MARKSKIDFYFANHGSVTLLTPLTDAAQGWVDDHLPELEPWQMFGKAIVIEPRNARDILQGLQGDGLTVGC